MLHLCVIWQNKPFFLYIIWHGISSFPIFAVYGKRLSIQTRHCGTVVKAMWI